MRRTVRNRGDDTQNQCADGELLPAGHACAVARLRSPSISALGSLAEKIALPATNVSAPASQTDLIVLRSMPPSTSRNALLPFPLSMCRARRLLSIEPFMHFCPPKPGATV